MTLSTGSSRHRAEESWVSETRRAEMGSQGQAWPPCLQDYPWCALSLAAPNSRPPAQGLGAAALMPEAQGPPKTVASSPVSPGPGLGHGCRCSPSVQAQSHREGYGLSLKSGVAVSGE